MIWSRMLANSTGVMKRIKRVVDVNGEMECLCLICLYCGYHIAASLSHPERKKYDEKGRDNVSNRMLSKKGDHIGSCRYAA